MSATGRWHGHVSAPERGHGHGHVGRHGLVSLLAAGGRVPVRECGRVSLLGTDWGSAAAACWLRARLPLGIYLGIFEEDVACGWGRSGVGWSGSHESGALGTLQGGPVENPALAAAVVE